MATWLLRMALATVTGMALGGFYCQLGDVAPYPTTSHRCTPQRGRDACLETHFCCSDDPAARGGALPAYAGRDIDGAEPLFSGANNARSHKGMCVRREEIGAGIGLLDAGAERCPVPCNPTWSPEEVEAVCGETFSCCQTVELAEADCVFDEELGCYRAARGEDILDRGDPWDAGAHATHQDPGLEGCSELEAEEGVAAVEDCYRQLSVADQRGFCMGIDVDAGQSCGQDKLDYQSACEVLNLREGLTECVD